MFSKDAYLILAQKVLQFVKIYPQSAIFVKPMHAIPNYLKLVAILVVLRRTLIVNFFKMTSPIRNLV